MTHHYNNAIIALSILFSLCLANGCDPVYLKTECRSYVGGYANLESIELWSSIDRPDVASSLTEKYSDYIIIEHGRDLPVHYYDMKSIGADAKIYDDLCVKHKDVSYYQYRSIGLVMDSTPIYNECDFTSIDVFADIDFDETHPAGSSLSDIVRFMSWSPQKYILSGYSDYYHCKLDELSDAFVNIMKVYYDEKYFKYDTEATCFPIDKLLKDIEEEDLVLLGYDTPGFIGALHFEKRPIADDVFTVTVCLHTDNGKLLTDTVKVRILNR